MSKESGGKSSLPTKRVNNVRGKAEMGGRGAKPSGRPTSGKTKNGY